MNYQFYHDTETDEILSYTELKELHSDLVRNQETEIEDFNDYLRECIHNGFLLGAVKLEVNDLLKILSEKAFTNYLSLKETSFYMDTWHNIYNNKGIYITCTENEDYRAEFSKYLEAVKA